MVGEGEEVASMEVRKKKICVVFAPRALCLEHHTHISCREFLKFKLAFPLKGRMSMVSRRGSNAVVRRLIVPDCKEKVVCC